MDAFHGIQQRSFSEPIRGARLCVLALCFRTKDFITLLHDGQYLLPIAAVVIVCGRDFAPAVLGDDDTRCLKALAGNRHRQSRLQYLLHRKSCAR